VAAYGGKRKRRNIITEKKHGYLEIERSG